MYILYIYIYICRAAVAAAPSPAFSGPCAGGPHLPSLGPLWAAPSPPLPSRSILCCFEISNALELDEARRPRTEIQY